MSTHVPFDRRDLDFLLHEVEGITALCRHPRFADHSRETFDATLDAAAELAMAKFANHNRASDVTEPHFADGRVGILPAVKDALDAYAEAGFSALLADAGEGGMQLPYTVALACDAMFAAANVSTAGYALLARGVANLLQAHATPEQCARYRTPILQGRFLGTMCLSEPQAGSSLGDIRTRAEPAGDGSYRLSGAKMWISGGEHDLSENIIHLVLARLPDAPPGVKGISLFIVPKFRVNDDGSLGARNDVQLAGVNHKLGQRGIVNTFLKFGERGECFGELVGAPHQGLAQMFHMMNEARIGVGVGAIMLGSAGYRYSLQYARERKQGRHPDQKDPASPPVAIIEHADVRRMLLAQKAYCEGALALELYCARLVDELRTGAEAAAREATPVLDADRPLAALLEDGLPLVPRPYDAWAQALDRTGESVLQTLQQWLDQGTVRRIGAIVRHHELGFDANAMTVFNIPDAQVDACGEALARVTGVTLAYRRERAGGWPYNLYCMVHGRDRAAVLDVIARAIADAGLAQYPHEVLFSCRRFKQTGPRRFRALPEAAAPSAATLEVLDAVAG